MSTRYPGGVISKTAPTLNPALGNAAPGVWTMDQAIQAIKAGTWPSYDPNFENVTLLLHGNGTNGGQNNTFLDSSTNNFTITRNGNTTQGTFSPYGSNWSNYFDGSGDYLQVADNAAFELGSGDFTLEGFVNFSALPASNAHQATFFSKWGGASTRSYQFYLYNNSGTYQLYLTYSTNGTTSTDVGVNWTPVVGTWYHIACVRNGSNLLFFVNGTQQGATQSISGTLSDQSTPLLIGSFNNTANSYMNGYISNARLVKGTAVYTSAFTPPTAPLTAISGTSLLTCADNRFIDDSTNNFAITVNGNTSVQRFSPFNPTAAYSAATIGGSGYFDGSGDYLSAPDDSAWFFDTGNFTIEFWYNPSSLASFHVLVEQGPNVNNRWILYWSASTGMSFDVASSSIGIISCQQGATTGWSTGAWYHVALVRNGTNFSIYRNGASIATATDADSIPDFSGLLYIGGGALAGDASLNGYISNLRIVKGTAVYTAAFTPPTAPLTAITNTQLLTNFTNASIIDNAMMNDLETVGNAQISTSVSKFGGGSMAFDGTGDYLVEPTNVNFGYGTGDFTIELWLYLNNTTADMNIFSNLSSGGGTNPHIYFDNSSDRIYYYTTGANRITSSVVVANTWYHVAVSRASGSTRMFINGTQVGSTYTDTNDYGASAPLWLGTSFNISSTLNGYIDDLRITKGVARYTANFTPPTSQLQDQ
jgi:hypothetical protein